MNSKCVLYGAVLIVAWYVTNALSAYYSKSVFVIAESTAEDDHLFHLSLLVSFAQLAGSGVVGYCYHRACSTSMASPWTYYAESQTRNPTWAKRVNIIAGCNAFGCVCTNIGYIYGSVSLVQLIKCMEPVATYICHRYVSPDAAHDSTTVAGVLFVIVGSCYTSYHIQR